MNDKTALTFPQFTIDSSIMEWLKQKETTRSGSPKTLTAYEDTVQQFRDFLAPFGFDLLSNPIDIARIAPIWASTRLPVRLTRDGEPNRRHAGEVSNSTYNQRLAILSSWYTFIQETYHLEIPNPVTVKNVKRRNVQEYAEVIPIDTDVVEMGLGSIDRDRKQGLRNYALLTIALYTGRRASELVGLNGEDVQIIGKGKSTRVILRFHCKGGKIEFNRLEEEPTAVFLEYVYAQFGKRLLALPPEAPIWVSYSRANSGQRISVQTLSKVCREAFGTSKNHALRHTFADTMKNLHAPITDLQKALGHTDVKITQRYVTSLDKTAENPLGKKLVEQFGIKRKSR